MYISLGGLFNICENGGGDLCSINYGGFCFIPFNAFMANSVIILYLEFLKGLISYFQILGQRDQNKKIYIKIYKRKHILNL